MWKPWNYLVGTGDEHGTQAPTGKEGDEETTTKKEDQESKPSNTASPGVWIITISNHWTEWPTNQDLTPDDRELYSIWLVFMRLSNIIFLCVYSKCISYFQALLTLEPSQM